MSRFRASKSTGQTVIAHNLYNRKAGIIETNPLAVKARENTIEGFIAFRQYVCYPQVAAMEFGVTASNDIAALKYARPKHHFEWMQSLYTGKDSSCLQGIAGSNTLILAPRLSAKSRFTVEYLCHQIGCQTNAGVALKILFISFGITTATPKSIEIKRMLESELYQHVFPTLRRGKKWGDEVWEIDKKIAGLPALGEPYSFVACGITGGITSRRAHLAVFDDLIKSPDQISNPAVREKMINTYKMAIRPTLFEGGRQLCIGTRMSGDDIYAEEFTEEKGWNVIEQQAIVEDDKGNEQSYWEEFIPLSYLKSLRDPPEGDIISFSFQYQNKIVQIEGLSIPEEWIHYSSPEDTEAYTRFAVGSDLADSIKRKADYTVFTLLGRLGNSVNGQIHTLATSRFKGSGNIYKLNQLLTMLYDNDILDLDEEGWKNPDDPIAKEFPIKYKSKPNVYVDLFLEDVSQQLSIQGDFNSLIKSGMGIHSIYPRPLKLKGDKRERLMSISGGMQTGNISFNRYRYSKTQSTIKELLYFGATQHDDCVDALTCGIIGMGYRAPLS
jgi:hypothetical protein